MTGRILTRVDGPVATIVVANLAKHNAMSLAMWRELRTAVQRLEADPAVRVIVLTGEGERAFVSGADISAFGETRTGEGATRAYDEAVEGAQAALLACSRPTVARIRGVCMGGGIGLALACDLRWATKGSRFRMPAARMGLGYRLAGMEQFVAITGRAVALDLFLTARTFDGLEARRLHLVHDAFDEEAFDAAVDGHVAAVARNAPLTLRAAKAAIRQCGQAGAPAAREAVEAMVRQCFASADYREGQLAFQERRAPQFQGC